MTKSKTIDLAKLKDLTETFIKYEIQQHGVDPRDTLEGTTLRIKTSAGEGYKYDIYKQCHEDLHSGKSYVDIAREAISNGNLVSFYQKGYLDDVIDQKGPDDLEQALALVYEGNDDKNAFNQLVGFIGGRFDIIAMLFFIKDCNKYLPLRSSIFDKKFAVLNIDSNLEGNCTWEKYQEFLSWIKEIQEYLVKYLNKDISFIDAHSFVWLLLGIVDYQNREADKSVYVESVKYGKGVVVEENDVKNEITVLFGKTKALFQMSAFEKGTLKYISINFDIYAKDKELTDSAQKESNSYKKVVEITEALLNCVQKKRWSITYQELSDMTESKPHRFLELPKILDKINASCVELDLPYISAIVVEAGKGVPGSGFRQLYEKRYGYDHFMSDKVIMQNEIAKIKVCNSWNTLAEAYGIQSFDDKDEELESLITNKKVIEKAGVQNETAKTIQEKKDNEYPKKYVTDLGIATTQWRNLLDDPDVFKDSDIELLKRIYMHDNHAATATELSVQDGASSSSYNAPVVALAKRISSALNLDPIIRENGTRIWWRIPFWGRYIDSGNFEWKIRPELVEALEDKYPELSNEVVNEKEDERLIDYLKDASLAETSEGFEYIKGARPKEEPKYVEGCKTYPRNHQTAINALAHACYKCEMDPTHPTFIRKGSDKPYTEPHHLVPMAISDQFDVSLDREQNIISLCSNCHNEIHYGRDARVLIEKLYEDRKELLESAGIAISLKELLKMYGITD